MGAILQRLSDASRQVGLRARGDRPIGSVRKYRDDQATTSGGHATKRLLILAKNDAGDVSPVLRRRSFLGRLRDQCFQTLKFRASETRMLHVHG